MSNTEKPNNQSFSFNEPPNKGTNEDKCNNFSTNTEGMIKFNLPKNQSSIIKVIGVGGGGSNAVNHMFRQGIKEVDFVVCNTDVQALNTSPVPNKIQLGTSLTEGRGAGAIPEVGKNAAVENIDEIKNILSKNTKMLFVTAGMGGGTGTGAAPVIAAVSKEMGILTVGIVTIPFLFEGRKRRLQAEEGIKELRKNVDSLLIICNDKLRELYGNLELSKAFAEADNVLTIAAKGIAEIITVPGYVNVDFEDVRTVMKDSGVAIMGSGAAEGEDRALKAVQQALSSPLLNDNNIKGASDMLLYISSGNKEVLMDEISEITEYIQKEAGATAEIIWGNGNDPSLGDKLCITLISTGFESNNGVDYTPKTKEIPVPKIFPLEPKEDKKEVVQPKEEVKTTPFQNEMDFVLKKPETEETPVINENLSENKYQNRQILEKTEDDFILYTTAPVKNEEKPPQKKESEISKAFQSIQSDSFNNEPEKENIKKPSPEITYDDNNQVDKLNKKRQEHLKDLSIKLKNPMSLAELEKVPAFVRKEEELPAIPHSSESQISNYSVSTDDENGKPKLKENNGYLHGKPD